MGGRFERGEPCPTGMMGMFPLPPLELEPSMGLPPDPLLEMVTGDPLTGDR